MTDYDVVVVGAGPAGSIAAKTAAEKGLDVLLIEKRQEIGVPVRCAEGVSREGLEKFVNPDSKWIASEIENAEIISPSNHKVVLSAENAGNEVGYVLERKIFDRYLARLASKAGADVLTKTSAVSFKRENGTVKLGIRSMGEFSEITAKIVIGADGVESRVAKWAGIDTTLKLNEIESCVQYLMTNIEFDDDTTYFWVGRKYAPGGYIWLFPKGKDAANVGIGVMPSLAEKSAKWYLDRFVEEHFPEGEIVEVVVGGVPVKGAIDTAVADNVMLAGDAARHTDPITGGGIINAMSAGHHAAIAAYEAIKAKDYSKETLKRYDEKWKSDFGESLVRNKKLQEKMMRLDDPTLDRLAKSLEGMPIEEMSVRRLAFELFKKHPRLLWDLREFIV
ncbi:NAD(P)/FAD-dependent oxidoreductase [Geoglobus acetivorans]|uniref:Digeranylgeranylglycerophospholipid reductase n=1 Tax=Geoglobus acetivorans TaxID=565033 RepID=A0A0A7GDW2_GEOAI|nr:geranylgeranyl reductase [Geoglobus acetivorans]